MPFKKKFKFTMYMDYDEAFRLPWSHIKAKLVRTFHANLGTAQRTLREQDDGQTQVNVELF
jgi:hypothetical protein